MVLDFKSRHIVVTGGTGALGSAVVGALLESGAICHVTCLERTELKHFPHDKNPSVRISEGVDVAKERSVEDFYARFTAAEPLWASIHIAGGFAMSPIDKTTAADFARMHETNTLTCFLCSREAVRRMRTGGAAQGGRIVNVAARPGLIPEMGAGMVAYASSKAAVAALTRALAAEVAPDGIWVNAVAPSIMDTPANRKAMPDADHSKWPTVAEVARTIAFLASPDNAVTRGGVVPVYGRA